MGALCTKVQNMLTTFAEEKTKEGEIAAELREKRDEALHQMNVMANTLSDMAKVLREDCEEQRQSQQAIEAQQVSIANILLDIAAALQRHKDA